MILDELLKRYGVILPGAKRAVTAYIDGTEIRYRPTVRGLDNKVKRGWLIIVPPPINDDQPPTQPRELSFEEFDKLVWG